MKRRLLYLAPLLLLSACVARPYQDRPPLPVAAKVAEANSPLRVVENVEFFPCSGSAEWPVFLYGQDEARRPLVAVVGRNFKGYYYLERPTWQEAVELVERSGYAVVSQTPKANGPKEPGWVVSVQNADLQQGAVTVGIPDGKLGQYSPAARC